MTSQILGTELATIISETKRKAPDIRTAAEQSLQELKALPSTSEAQIAADLRRRPLFISPFLAASKSRQPKAVLSAVACLQRLIVSKGLPPERLKGVLEAFKECVGNGLDVQLKILQSLPSLLQGYGEELEGELQIIIVQLCTALQQVKNSAVSSTASATLQQTISTLYEKVEAEDEAAEDIAPIEGVVVHDESIPVRPAAYDAHRILQDTCLIIEGQQPHYLVKASISPSFGLELIETLLLNHTEVFTNHVEQSDLLLCRVMPLVNSCLSDRYSFAVTVRALRILCILLREHLETVQAECEVTFGLLNHIIEMETQQAWRRALCLEVFRLLYTTSGLFLDVYSIYDLKESRRNIIQDNQALFVRLASEKPALIGLGQQSTAPASRSIGTSKDQAVLGAEAAAGMIGGDFGVGAKDVPGISSEWSIMKLPCLDQVDKADPPVVPETYIYSLVLNCVNHLSDLLAKIVLPAAMHQGKSHRARSPNHRADGEDAPNEHNSGTHRPKRQPSSRAGRSRSIPTNPLEMEGHPAYASIQVVASVINSCWPAVLATASTFFNATLDADFYRGLVRSFQKFTQVAGILRLTTPRDALLTALSKFAVPSNLLSSDSTVTSPTIGGPSSGGSVRSRGFPFPMAEAFSSTEPDTPSRSRRSSLDVGGPTMTQRNLTCLRALVHLAIALGPILDRAWSIVLESMQKAHVVLSASRNIATAQDYKSSQLQAELSAGTPTLGSEIAAVESAMTRLFQSSCDYPSESFTILLAALCSLLRDDAVAETKIIVPPASGNLAAPQKPSRRVPSVSGLSSNADIRPEYSHFAVLKLGDTAIANSLRLCQNPSEGWDLVITTLMHVTSAKNLEDRTRKTASEIVARLGAEACISGASLSSELRQGIQQRAFKAFRSQLRVLPNGVDEAYQGIDMDVLQTVLDALHSTLDHCGDSVITGWTLIFDIVGSVFRRNLHDNNLHSSSAVGTETLPLRPLSAKLARSSFASLQLVCSDFIGSLPHDALRTMVNLLAQFGLQELDMNISLTVVTQFWNISDYLQKRTTVLSSVEDDESRDSSALGSMLGDTLQVWLLLQQRLAQMTRDERADVRNGSIHTIYRTIDTYGEQLSPRAIEAYISTVLFTMMEIDIARQKRIRTEQTTQDIVKAFDSSSQLILQGCARFFTARLATISHLGDFELIWKSQLDILCSYLDVNSHSISQNVFAGLTQILAASSDHQSLSRAAINKIASLWAKTIPPSSESGDDVSHQEKAFIAYIQCIEEIYRHLNGEVQNDQVNLILERVRECILTCRIGPYSNDIDQPTDLQRESLQTCSVLEGGNLEDVLSVLGHLAHLVRLPYDSSLSEHSNGSPTFIALAKQAMQLAAKIVAEQKATLLQSEGSALSAVFESLVESIRRQYTWNMQGKKPFLWQVATSSSLSMLGNVLSGFDQHPSLQQCSRRSLQAAITIIDAIQMGEYDDEPPEDDIIIDETFDLEAVHTCRSQITPLLDSVPDLEEERMQYVEVLNKASILHMSPFDDTDEPLSSVLSNGPEQLNVVRSGRTFEPDFKPRVRMCYSCFDELFDLATLATLTSNDSDSRTPRSREAALLVPIAHQALLVRCSVPLKRYIADQPLRGRMPTPMSQRLELLHILRRIRSLYDTDDDSNKVVNFDRPTQGWPGILDGLAPLINQARELTGADRELAQAMSKILSMAFARRTGDVWKIALNEAA